jgi:heavy metal sensor kinase
MNPRSLRFRLVTWYALGLGVVFIVTGTLLFFGLRQYLESNLAGIQERRAERIASLVMRTAASGGHDFAAAITNDFAPEASGRFVRVTRSDGVVVYQSGAPRDRSFDPTQVSAPPRKPGVRKERLGEWSELVMVAIPSDPGVPPRYLIESGESLGPALAELHRLLFSLGLAFVLVAAVALGGGLLLVGRALRPVAEITRSADGITSRNLSERLPVPPTGDEFEHLSRTLNGMIERLDQAFQLNHRFLADASHELRTPLTVLRSELEIMAGRPGLNADVRDSVGSLLEEVQRLVHIVETLLALSRFETGQTRPEYRQFDFAELAAATADQMCLLAEDKGQVLTCEMPAPVLVEGDRARLKQVIVNLLDNAIKYTPRGGAVRLAVMARGNEAVCEVTDNGIGIPDAALAHIFERFFRVDAARSHEVPGAGIGLSIVKVICAAHNGRVEVESTEGRGSRFRVCLPLAGQTFHQHKSL